MSRQIRWLIPTAALLLSMSALAVTGLAQEQAELTDLGRHSMEALAIKTMVAQQVMTTSSPGKFEPNQFITRGDFAIALQRLFNLPQPGAAVKFADLHSTDAVYPAAEAAALYLDKQVPCPGCDVGAKFLPERHVTRAQLAVSLVRILVAQGKLQLASDSQTDQLLAAVPDAVQLAKPTRAYIATALQAAIIDCCAGNTIELEQQITRADAAETLYNIQRRFDLPPAKPLAALGNS